MWKRLTEYWKPKLYWREYLWGIAGALTGGAATCYLIANNIFGGSALQVVSAVGTLAAGLGAFYAGYVALDLEKNRIVRDSAVRDAGSKVCYQVVATELKQLSFSLGQISFCLRSLSHGLRKAEKYKYSGKNLEFLLTERNKIFGYLSDIKFESFLKIKELLTGIAIDDAIVFSEIKRIVDIFPNSISAHIQILEDYDELELGHAATIIYASYPLIEELKNSLKSLRVGDLSIHYEGVIEDSKREIYKLTYEGMMNGGNVTREQSSC